MQAGAAGAIITRHDVDQSHFRRVGERFRRTVVSANIPDKTGVPQLHNGMGTLIAPTWVLTAGHVAIDAKPGHPKAVVKGRHHFIVDGRPYPVADVVLHPGFEANRGEYDIALVKLGKPVRGGRAACLYGADDELGKVVINVGMGLPGTGLTGPQSPDRVLRGATARVSRAEKSRMGWAFRAPEEREVTPLEGISGPGDSGGPAFIYVDGRPCVAGVSSGQMSRGRKEGHYGVFETYSRVSFHKAWIEKTMKEHGAVWKGP
jgi:hypothetical protein